MNNKTTAPKAMFFGIIIGFTLLGLVLFGSKDYPDTLIPLTLFIVIILTAIGLLVYKPSPSTKKQKNAG